MECIYLCMYVYNYSLSKGSNIIADESNGLHMGTYEGKRRHVVPYGDYIIER